MTNELRNKVIETLNDETFNTEIANIETLEAIHEALTARGIEVTQEEMEAVLEELAAEVKEPEANEELSEEELEAVAGGGLTLWAIAILLGISVALLKYYLYKKKSSEIARRARALMK